MALTPREDNLNPKIRVTAVRFHPSKVFLGECPTFSSGVFSLWSLRRSIPDRKGVGMRLRGLVLLRLAGGRTGIKGGNGSRNAIGSLLQDQLFATRVAVADRPDSDRLPAFQARKY